MKNKIIKACLVFVSILLVTACNSKQEKFYLEDFLYQEGKIEEITSSELEKLIKEKKNFGLNIYQPMCNASYEFSEVLTTFAEDKQLTFYKIQYADIENTHLEKVIKHYPSFVIYENGKIVDYLDAELDADIKKFKTYEGFDEWFTKYVKMKEIKENNEEIEEENSNLAETEDDDFSEFNDILKDITYNENKVNIYFFFGDGCHYCESEYEFFKEIENEYGKYYKLYRFEVLYNEKHQELLELSASVMGDQIRGIPYTIIGSKTFIGFNEEIKQEMLEAIKQEYDNSYDIFLNNN